MPHEDSARTATNKYNQSYQVRIAAAEEVSSCGRSEVDERQETSVSDPERGTCGSVIGQSACPLSHDRTRGHVVGMTQLSCCCGGCTSVAVLAVGNAQLR